MKFDLDEQQGMIRDSCRQFMSQRYTLEGWTRVSREGGFSRANWDELATLGYLGIGLPEAYGGIGSVVELAVVCEEFGRGLLLEPFLGTVFASQLIAVAGTDAQRAELLPQIVQGQKIVAVAHAEPGLDGDGAPSTYLRREGNTFVLRGQKRVVLAAANADLLIVSARNLMGRTTLLLVDPGQAGVSIAKAPLLDRTWCADVNFDEVRVEADRVLGAEDGGDVPLRDALRVTNLAICAEMIGIMDRALEQTVAYMKTRSQFGAPIASFQALRHRVADLAIDLEMSRGVLLALLQSFQDPQGRDPDATAAMAKAYLGEAGRRVCGQAVQLHGGMGLTDECGVGRYFARTHVINTLFGATDSQFETYTQLLRQQLKSGGSPHV